MTKPGIPFVLLTVMALLVTSACASAPATPASGGQRPGAAAAPPAASAAPTTPASQAAPASPPSRATVRFGGLGGTIDRPLFVGEEKGYFEQQGITLEVENFRTAADMIPVLATGRLDAGHGSTSAGFFNAILTGVSVKIVSDVTVLRQPGPGIRNSLWLVVRKDLADQLRGMSDFSGRTIGINQRGTVNQGQLEKMLQQVGLRLDDVTIESIPFPDQMTALANGAIDAAVAIEPFVTLMQDRDVATPLIDMGQPLPGHPVQVLFYGPDFIRDQPDVGRRFALAYMQAQRYLEDALRKDINRDEVIQMFVKHTQVKDAALHARLRPSYSEPNGGVNTQAIEFDQDFYVRHGLQRAPIAVGTIVDPSYSEYAVQRLGRYQD
jgi:NitT/TauT family transport system substrate-binding protein